MVLKITLAWLHWKKPSSTSVRTANHSATRTRLITRPAQAWPKRRSSVPSKGHLNGTGLLDFVAKIGWCSREKDYKSKLGYNEWQITLNESPLSMGYHLRNKTTKKPSFTKCDTEPENCHRSLEVVQWIGNQSSCIIDQNHVKPHALCGVSVPIHWGDWWHWS